MVLVVRVTRCYMTLPLDMKIMIAYLQWTCENFVKHWKYWKNHQRYCHSGNVPSPAKVVACFNWRSNLWKKYLTINWIYTKKIKLCWYTQLRNGIWWLRSRSNIPYSFSRGVLRAFYILLLLVGIKRLVITPNDSGDNPRSILRHANLSWNITFQTYLNVKRYLNVNIFFSISTTSTVSTVSKVILKWCLLFSNQYCFSMKYMVLSL